MYALRFGTIPVVRATGGLADTIEHFNPAQGTGNGSVFAHADAQGLAWGIGQALAWFADEAVWATLMRNAMAADFSWQRRVGQYVAMYERLL
jgi:starch synthase